LTYDQLDRKSNAFARGLVNRGVRRGDRCAVMLGNNIEFATVGFLFRYLFLRLSFNLLSGNICIVQTWCRTRKVLSNSLVIVIAKRSQVPLNPAFNSIQVISALSHLNAAHLIISAETNLPRKIPRSNIALLKSIIPNLHGHKLESEAVPSLINVILVDNSDGRFEPEIGQKLRTTTNYEDVLEDGGAGLSLSDQGLKPDEVVNIQFTSGTTSMPKAAMLSHRSILNNGKSIGDRMLLTPEDVVCCPPPLFQFVLRIPKGTSPG
jgi:acyl-CoA synthetase (AMP-forming)/AMP-acid ligase II